MHLYGGISILLYFAFIGKYTRLSNDPIIFFASLIIGIVVIAIVVLILWRSRLFDYFTLLMIGLYI